RDVDEPLLLQIVPAEQVPALMAAYRQACDDAAEMREVVTGTGLADELVAVVASLDAAGEPRVCVLLTRDGGQRLIALLRQLKQKPKITVPRPPAGDPGPDQPRPQAA
ncbi:MAG: hypothetical protein L0Y54_19515, partial [Sporichthyaceae bacterium]|nr:hypothetical protein [Sporichthyaceae bacterium]